MWWPGDGNSLHLGGSQSLLASADLGSSLHTDPFETEE